MSDFDSGDELFDGVDPDQILSQQTPPSKRKHEVEANGNHEKRQRGDDDVILIDEEGGETIAHADEFPDDLDVADNPGPNVAKEASADVMAVARKLLIDTFGYEAFRHEQEAAIRCVLGGGNALTVFPTGAGKSLCYQIPAFAFPQIDLMTGARSADEHGITVVVSPLIALMKDQVDALRRRRLPADVVDSTRTWEQQQQSCEDMRRGATRILYCAPERLNNEGFVARMRHVRGGVRLLAVDEAHCVSEWGHSFRPEYLKVARFAEEIGAERVVCLTATATPEVVRDICAAFRIEPDAGVFRTSVYRPNLNLNVRATATKKEKDPLLCRFLADNSGPTLVYVTFQQQAAQLAADLRKKGFDAEAFHAGLGAEVKANIQDSFLANKVRIVVATIAFGMGIDKPDIRNIVHYDLSSTIEEYSQQIGRAGRDGKPSNCMFYICPEDWYIRENFARGDLPSRRSLKALMLDIFSAENRCKPVGDTFKTSHYVQSREFDVRMEPLATIYAALELQFGLIRAITPEYSEYKFEPTKTYFGIMAKDKSPEGKAIYTGAVKKIKLYYVDPRAIVAQTGVSRVDLIRRLNELHDTGVIALKAGGIEQRYRVLRALPRSDTEIEDLVDKVHADLSRREQDALRRTRKVEELVTGDRCLAVGLAAHFGMELPGGKKRCGHCTHCVTGKRTAMPPRPKKELDVVGVRKILKACDVRDDARFLARIAFGIKSPRVTRLKMDKHEVFMSLADHDFESLLKEFTKACNE